jgi:hypothetical protein
MGCISCKRIGIASAGDIEAKRISEVSRTAYVASGYGNFQSWEMAQRRALPLSMVPFARDPAFVGREDILEKLTDLLTPSNTHKRAALVGIGGIG